MTTCESILSRWERTVGSRSPGTPAVGTGPTILLPTVVGAKSWTPSCCNKTYPLAPSHLTSKILQIIYIYSYFTLTNITSNSYTRTRLPTHTKKKKDFPPLHNINISLSKHLSISKYCYITTKKPLTYTSIENWFFSF